MSSTTSSVQESPERQHRYNADTDEGYGSFTTASTTLTRNSSLMLNKDDGAHHSSISERSTKFDGRTDGTAAERSDDEDAAKDLVDWPTLHEQVQTLVSRLNNWLHHPLPDRHIPVRKSHVDHAYPILQRRTSSMPLVINLATDESIPMPRQSNIVVRFVQNDENGQLASGPLPSTPRSDIQSSDQQKQV